MTVKLSLSTLLLLLGLISLSSGFAILKVGPTRDMNVMPKQLVSISPFMRSNNNISPKIYMTTSSEEGIDTDDEDEDDDPVEPGKMRVSEIKAELNLRGVRFADCFDKASLVNRLEEARKSGKSDPTILDDFNKKKVRKDMLLLI